MFANLAGVLDFADSFEEKLNGLLKKIKTRPAPMGSLRSVISKTGRVLRTFSVLRTKRAKA